VATASFVLRGELSGFELTGVYRNNGVACLNLSSAILQNHPAVSLYASSLRGLDIWLAHQQSDVIAFPLLAGPPNYGLIVRQNWKPQVHRLEKTEWAVLSKLFQGES
jgi:hypothetical protein